MRMLAAGDTETVGVLCLYSKETAPPQVDKLGSVAARLSAVLGRLYVAAVQHSLAEFRRDIVASAAFRNDPGSLAHDFLQARKWELQFEAGSVWLWDPR